MESLRIKRPISRLPQYGGAEGSRLGACFEDIIMIVQARQQLPLILLFLFHMTSRFVHQHRQRTASATGTRCLVVL